MSGLNLRANLSEATYHFRMIHMNTQQEKAARSAMMAGLPTHTN